ncbi:hypothetical protein [Bacillus sp. FJAT-27445]|uniref:hypothetical protein n=1 Tax=Bacillus sp. FJAT-27445 TaxID=1679166 RepID=UPI0007435510|nr:hypothetical protein [Bacillus sp. FJAT-27445]
MSKRHVFEEAEFYITAEMKINVFSCPECGFSFDSQHECDDELGGCECPLCELADLEGIIKQQTNEIDQLKTRLQFKQERINGLIMHQLD